jgi:hypothetical protein
MKEGKEWKTAFQTRYRLFKYQVMLMGLMNAPATCQMMVNNLFQEHLDDFVVVYLDDILIYSKLNSEHMQHVKKVMALLDSANLQLNGKKCEFHQEEVNFLGFTIGTQGVWMDQEKISSIKTWPKPKNLKEV